MSLLEIIDLKTHFPTPNGLVKAVDTIDMKYLFSSYTILA